MSELDRVRELLAFHAQGVLRGDDLEFMDRWLERNERDHPEITAELAWLRGTAAHLRAQVQSHSLMEREGSEAGLKELLERIALEKKSAAGASLHVGAVHAQADRPASRHTDETDKRTWGSRTLRWLGAVAAIRSPALAFSLLAVVIGQAGVIGILSGKPPASQTPLSAASSSVSRPQGQRVLTVAFRPQATESAIREALARSSAQIIAGPSALGLYTVAVPGVEADIMQTRLRAAIEVVESVQR